MRRGARKASEVRFAEARLLECKSVQDSAVPQNVPTAVFVQAELKELSRIISRMSLCCAAARWDAIILG
jgi:hypothetical protein